MKRRQLGNTGLDVSILGFGASGLGSVFGDYDESEGIRTVHEALDLGINLIDVSPYYGATKAETVLGKSLKSIPRDQYYLSTKAGRFGVDDFDFSASRIMSSVDESLQRLGVDYLDFLHLHDIEFVDLRYIIEESIPALYRLKEQGKIRFCGISGYPLKIFGKILDQAPVDTILTYCHYSLNDTSLLDQLDYLESKGVGIINASPLSMGLLTKRGEPDWHFADDTIKAACRKAAAHCAAKGEDIAKLAIQFSTANERIPTTLVSSVKPENIRNNVRWLEEDMDVTLLQEVQEVLRPIHNRTWLSGREENN